MLLQGAPGEIASELTPAQISEIKQGHQVFVATPIPESAWPKTRVYRLIDATPEEVTAVFFSYTQSPHFIPNVKSATVAKQNSINDVEVEYVLAVPLLSDEHYRTRNITSLNGDGMYRVDWTLLKAMRTKSSIGHMRAEPFENKTLMSYCSTTVPLSSIAFLLKKIAMQQVHDTVESIAKEVEKERKSEPPLLEKEVTQLRAALDTTASPTPTPAK